MLGYGGSVQVKISLQKTGICFTLLVEVIDCLPLAQAQMHR